MVNQALKPTNEKTAVDAYTEEGLSRLAKEKLVTIISTLQNMPVQLAMKVSNYIPDFFNICDGALARVDSAYRIAVEELERDAKRQINSLNNSKKLYERDYNKAKTNEEKAKYKAWMDEIDIKIQDVQKETEKTRSEYFNAHARYAVAVVSLAAVGIGGTIKLGKRIK